VTDDVRFLIERIEIIRGKNNGNWMEILRIALECAPDRTRDVLYRIIASDEAVTHEMRQLLETK
jgi:hypothetical protein